LYCVQLFSHHQIWYFKVFKNISWMLVEWCRWFVNFWVPFFSIYERESLPSQELLPFFDDLVQFLLTYGIPFSL
jgi:hypothetical protein